MPLFATTADAPWRDVAPGVRRQILSHDPAMMTVRVAFEKGAVGAMHQHPHTQVSVVERGVFDVTIAGETKRLQEGDIYHVPSDAVHGCVAVEAGALLDVFTPRRDEFLDD
ncbi:cupin domain-containing protein [Geminicoccus roseus]|uniref:cupin domain-containing protein n=1 Tax=Geminicoccus roseus TaxID=404900 RepID=UPI00041334A6|nr:cupin domain-containing protein [Geminicoccus roseus]